MTTPYKKKDKLYPKKYDNYIQRLKINNIKNNYI